VVEVVKHDPALVAKVAEVKNGLGGLTEVAILADFTEHVSELHDQKIEEARAKAEELRKKMENKEDVDFEHFEAELERSLTRIKIADKWKTRKYRK
jgi:F0F1-type ATP synthase epsilon subunit